MTSILAKHQSQLIRASSGALKCTHIHRLPPCTPAGASRSLAPLSSLPPAPFRSLHSPQPGFSRGIRVAASAMAPQPSHVMFEPESLPSVRLVADRTNVSTDLDLLFVAVTEEDILKKEGEEAAKLNSDRVKALDEQLGGLLSDCVSTGGFEGKKASQSSVIRVGRNTAAPGFMGAKAIALVGLGKAADVTPTNAATSWGPSCFQAAGAGIATTAKSQRASKAGVILLDAPFGGAEADKAASITQLSTGVMLSGYETTRFKTKPSPTATKLSELVIMDGSGNGSVLPPGAAAEAALAKARAVAQGNFLTRYLVESPPNVCNPTHMANTAAHIAQQAPETMQLEVLEKKDCEAMNMGLYLGVDECSEHPPKFIHLKYTPKGGSNGKSIALVGKGLTFDSGGYNIKAGAGSLIEMMKFDMGGAGATLGAARIIAGLQPQGPEVHFIVASCENMVDGKGLRPGDVLTSASGKTVEVNNTDAEGRLTLADALWFAQEKCGATAIVDTATLTGACLIALGDNIGGLFSPSDSAAGGFIAASKLAGEKVWRLPMEESYFEQLKSPIADMKNTGGRFGGSITAALFLKQFINEKTEWCHVDMAGPVWSWSANYPTGYCAATLAEWVLAHGKK